MDFKKFLPHLLAFIACLVVTFIFFKPTFTDNKVLNQGDLQQAFGMQGESFKYKQQGELIKWPNQQYIGMPTYLFANPQEGNMIKNITDNVMFGFGMFDDCADPHVIYFWLAMWGYIGLLLFGFSSPVALIGGLSFAMMTDNILLLEAGHCHKVIAIGLSVPVLGSAWQLLRGKYLWGGLAFAIFASLQLGAGHVQMVYYTYFIIAALVLASLAYRIKRQDIATWVKTVLLMGAGVLIGVLSNLSILWATYEYSKESVRGKTELVNKELKDGMNKDAIFAWAHSKMETYTLMMPSFIGGSSRDLWVNDKESETSKTLRKIAQQGLPQDFITQLSYSTGKYWGHQVFTAGPIYYGAVICFLAFLGFFAMRSPLRYGLAGVLFFFMLLSWGQDFKAFNYFMVDYFPFYNKFRDVKMCLVIGQGATIILAAYGLQFVTSFMPVVGATKDLEAIAHGKKALKKACILAGVLIGFAFLYSIMGDLSTNNPNYYYNLEHIRSQSPQVATIMEELEAAMRVDRAGLIQADALRTLLFMLLAAGMSWAAIHNKMSPYLAALVIAGAALVDLGMIEKSYVNEKSFQPLTPKGTPYRIITPTPSQANINIMKDTTKHFRVLDFSRGTPTQTAHTSYFHKSIGGHHAARPMLYDELTTKYPFNNEAQIINNYPHLLSMLNMRHYISSNGTAMFYPEALGNVWFVNKARVVANADEELEAIGNFVPLDEVIVQAKYSDYVANLPTETAGVNDRIYLASYHPDTMVYKYTAQTERFAVFSEIYYTAGWNVYLDGQKIEPGFIKVNYLLRGMRLPAGEHTIEMRFEPKSFAIGEMVSMIVSLAVLLALAAALCLHFRKGRNQNTIAPEA